MKILEDEKLITHMEEISDACCDSVGYYQIVGNVFQWLINNNYVVVKNEVGEVPGEPDTTINKSNGE